MDGVPPQQAGAVTGRLTSRLDGEFLPSAVTADPRRAGHCSRHWFLLPKMSATGDEEKGVGGTFRAARLTGEGRPPTGRGTNLTSV